MGSFFAGIKAGTLGGLLYFGGMLAFNVSLLYVFKSNALAIISQTHPQSCPAIQTINSSSLEECFSSVVIYYPPYLAFSGFLLSLVFVGAFGAYYERFPGRTSLPKGETIATLIGVVLIIEGLAGVWLGFPASELLAVFLLVWTGIYGWVLGRLYARYTRLVRFESQNPESIRVFVGRRDYTGREVTLAHTSTHQIRADVADNASFKEWTVSGGITVDDPRSFETAMEVNGNGTLRAQGGKKY